MRKTLLVTGASTGIGAAVARMAAEHGYDLALTYLSDEAGTQAVADDARASGAKVLVIRTDVGDPEAIDALFHEIDSAFPRLDALCNNAGMVGAKAKVADLTPERLRRIFDVNTIGAILVARAAVERMLAAGGGSIVNVSSVAARLGSGNQYVDYAASKAAIDTFTKGLSDEVSASGIRVNAVRPGIIETGIHARGGEPDRAVRLGPTVPMARSGSAEEVAEAILWLLSDSASYVTGTLLDVSGGR